MRIINNYDLHSATFKYLRSKKAEFLHAWYMEAFEEKRNLCAKAYANATVLPLKRFDDDNLLFGRGGVVDENNNYIEDSSINRRVQYNYEFTDSVFYNEKVVYCGYLVNQWGHFLIEGAARLWYYLEHDNESIDKYVFFTDYGKEIRLTGNYKEFLVLLGVYDKIEIINKPTTYKEVIVPELAYNWRRYYSNSYKAVFDTIAKNAKTESDWIPYDKIYFTRSALENVSRKEYGLDMLDNYYEKNGYLVVSPEKLSLSHLIFLLRNAQTCASLSGTLPHNLLFAEDGKELVVIERNILNNEIQVDINRMKKLSVIYIDANIGVYPINLGYGPFIMTYHGRLEQFSKDYGYIPPDDKYLTKKYLDSCFKRYMKEYQRSYGYQWFMADWAISATGYMKEAYDESLQYYGDYIYGYKPYKMSQFMEWNNVVRFIKHFIQRVLANLR